MPLFNGTAGDDILNGTIESDTIKGLAGNDTIYGFEADDTLSGGDGDDQLYGGDGNDILNGDAGADTMRGGTGNDTYVVDNAGDLPIEGSSAGTDRVKSWISYILGANVENLTLIGTAAINGSGNGLANVIVGNGAANILNGFGGADTMKGGAGDDTYVVDNAGDRTIEAGAADGTDLVKSSLSFTLASYLENLTLIGTAAIDGTGNDLANVIVGNRAANVLDGLAGADTMNGGAGDDMYEVENVGDVAIETTVTGGTDLVESYVSYTLGLYLDNLTLLGSAAINGTGNDFANTIIGNGAANILNGGGRDDVLDGRGGGDTMIGGTGDDTYYVNSASDAVVENVSQGIDTVHATIDYTLAANVENGIVDGLAGLMISGNKLSNVLTGGSGADTLIGLTGNDTLMGGAGNDSLNGGSGTDVLNGGTGDDTMVGHLGNDTYYVDSVADVVTENSGAGTGTDTVNVTVSYTLSGNVENGTILQGLSGVTLNGNELDNFLTGDNSQAATSTLNGFGGNDTLNGANIMAGGTGNDLYYINFTGGQVIEAPGEGIDTVSITTQGYTMPDNVELAYAGGTYLFFGAWVQSSVQGNSLANGITGGYGPDQLYGGGGNDSLYGGNDSYSINAGDSDDRLYGEAGDDAIHGQDGDDMLDGGDGNDLLFGELGQDQITTGAGNDLIVYNDSSEALFDSVGRPNDEITDFDVAFDAISLIAIDANQVAEGFQGFHFTGTTWDHTIGDVWVQSDNPGGFGDGYYLYTEMNGDAFADMAIHLILPGGITSFTDSNLII